MTHRILVFSILVLLVQPVLSQDAPMGVLIGIQRHGSDSITDSQPWSAGSLRTVWVPLDQTSLSTRVATVDLSYLLIPRRSGFWQAGLAGTCEAETVTDIDNKPIGIAVTVSDYFWAAPAGSPGSIHVRSASDTAGSCGTKRPRCENDYRTTLYWVWPDYVSLDASERSECGVHPDFDAGYAIRSLDSLETAKSITDILGAAADAPVKAAFGRALREQESLAGAHCDLDQTRPPLWRIERKNGQWTAKGWQDTPRSCGYGIDFEVNLDLSPITGRKDDAARRQQLQKRIPNLTDAHFSPGGAWSLVAAGKQLMILHSDSDKPAVTLRLSNHETLIMVEWATGRNVARWTAEVRRLQNVKPQEPVMLPSSQ
jgi:hypothetical protein